MNSAECCGLKYAVSEGQWIECPKCGASITHKPLKARTEPVAEVPCSAGLSDIDPYNLECLAMAIVNHTNDNTGTDVKTR